PTIFSLITDPMLPAPRPPQPMMTMFSFSLGDRHETKFGAPSRAAPAAAAVVLRNRRRVREASRLRSRVMENLRGKRMRSNCRTGSDHTSLQGAKQLSAWKVGENPAPGRHQAAGPQVASWLCRQGTRHQWGSWRRYTQRLTNRLRGTEPRMLWVWAPPG